MRHAHFDESALTPVRRGVVLLPVLLGVSGWWGHLLSTTGGWIAHAAIGGLLASLAVLPAMFPLRRRSPQYLSLIGLGLAVWGLFAPFAGAWTGALVLSLSGLATFVAAGYLSLWRMRPDPEIPQPSENLAQVLKVALDEWVIGYFSGSIRVPDHARRVRIVAETKAGLDYFRQQGWIDDPASFHVMPDVPAEIERQQRRFGRLNYESLRYPSGYQAPVNAPGAARWQAQGLSPFAYARIFRHPEPGRPWLVCIHGYRMGARWMDFSLFSPGWLHHKLGFNLAMPLLPLHGPRKAGWRSGDGYLDGDLLDIVYTQAQAVWDLRRLLAWLRQKEGAERISVLGYSLGGYNAALLASLENNLEAVIAAIPLADIASVLWEHGPQKLLRHIHAEGVGPQEVRRLLRVVSPLVLRPRVPVNRRFIMAGQADRVVPLPPILDLWRHWEKPALEWFDGTHLSVRREPDVPGKLEGFFAQAGFAIPQPASDNSIFPKAGSTQ